MSVWTTKALSSDKEYIVLKHKLRGVNYTVQGIKFRDGYAVVEKDSKTYHGLLKMPILQGCQEYPLVYLRKLKFVTRASDVKTIFGQDVYRQYVQVLNNELNAEQKGRKEQSNSEHLASGGCGYRLANGEYCDHDGLPESPSKYCKTHLLEDPKLAEKGIKVPGYVTKDERGPLKEKVLKQLAKTKEV